MSDELEPVETPTLRTKAKAWWNGDSFSSTFVKGAGQGFALGSAVSIGIIAGSAAIACVAGLFSNDSDDETEDETEDE